VADGFRVEARRQAEDVIGDVLGGVVAEVARSLAVPRTRAFAAGYMGTAVLLAAMTRGRLPFLPYLACCVAGGYSARAAWQLAADVHAIAAIQRTAMDQITEGP
jgi:hypothetical protein